MILAFVSQPDGLSPAVDDRLSRMLSSLPDVENEDREGAVRISDFVPLFALGLRDASRGMIADRVELVYWRTFIFKGEAVVAAVDFNVLGERQVGEPVAVHTGGELIGNTIEAIRMAEEAEVAGGIYDVRLLLIQSVYVLALWLWEEVGGVRKVMPIPPTNKKFEAYKLYDESEFASLLGDEAAKRVVFSSPL